MRAFNSVTTPVIEPKSEQKTRQLPPYHVLIENDEHHSMQFVVMVLQRVFGHSLEDCVKMMLHAHEHGEAIVWTGSKEVAELKLEQLSTYHEKHHTTGNNIGPLFCRIERAH